MRKVLLIAGIVVAILVVAAVALPFFVNADTFRPRIEAELTQALGRETHIGRLRLSLLAGGVTANNLSIAEDPSFGKEPFLTAKSLDVGVDMGALIFSHALHIRSLTLVDPEVALLHSATGKWNFSSLGANGPKRGTSAPEFSVEKLRIVRGKIVAGEGRGGKYEYSDVSLDAANISPTSPIPFTLDANTPGAGRLHLEGHAGPMDAGDAARTPMQASVSITGMDLAKTGFATTSASANGDPGSPRSGISGLLDFNGTITSDGRTVHSDGTGKVQQLLLVRGGSPARQPVTFQYATDYDLRRESGALTSGILKTGDSGVRMSGTYETKAETVVHLKLNGRDLPVQDVAGLLPALGVVLPAGSSLQGGSITADLAVNGPLDGLVTTGDLRVDNVKLAGFNLGSKMSRVAALAGIRTGSDTTIQMMSSNLRIAPEGIRADNLNVVVPELGTVTGAGTVAGDNTLHFKLNAKLTNGAGLVGGLQRVAGLGQAPKNGIPFLVQGTTANPVFLPDVGGMMGSTVQAPAQGIGGILGGLFKKREKKK